MDGPILAGARLPGYTDDELERRASFEFCFDGVAEDQVLTISVADLRRPHVERRFRAGLDAMIERLRPRLLLVYGNLRFDPGCPVLEVPPAWTTLRLLG